MTESGDTVDRVQFENRIMAELTGLAMSAHTYADAIRIVLDLVEQIVSSPLLTLAISEASEIGFYARAGEGVNLFWADDVGRYIADTQRRQLEHTGGGQRTTSYHIVAPAAWIAAFSAESRSGRRCMLTLGCPRPLTLRPDEEGIMERLTRQVLLVLDHALLLERLESQEVIDALTGVANHRRMLEILEYEMLRHRYHGRLLSLMLVDVEGLDGINRSYGRQYGNHILSKLAKLIGETVRPIDSVARCGMDEFAVVLPETSDEEAHHLAERLRERVLGAGFAGGAIGVSVDVAQVKPDETLSAEGFLRRAEQILHETKRQERGWTAMRRPSALGVSRSL